MDETLNTLEQFAIAFNVKLHPNAFSHNLKTENKNQQYMLCRLVALIRRSSLLFTVGTRKTLTKLIIMIINNEHAVATAQC